MIYLGRETIGKLSNSFIKASNLLIKEKEKKAFTEKNKIEDVKIKVIENKQKKGLINLRLQGYVGFKKFNINSFSYFFSVGEVEIKIFTEKKKDAFLSLDRLTESFRQAVDTFLKNELVFQQIENENFNFAKAIDKKKQVKTRWIVSRHNSYMRCDQLFIFINDEKKYGLLIFKFKIIYVDEIEEVIPNKNFLRVGKW